MQQNKFVQWLFLKNQFVKNKNATLFWLHNVYLQLDS